MTTHRSLAVLPQAPGAEHYTTLEEDPTAVTLLSNQPSSQAADTASVASVGSTTRSVASKHTDYDSLGEVMVNGEYYSIAELLGGVSHDDPGYKYIAQQNKEMQRYDVFKVDVRSSYGSYQKVREVPYEYVQRRKPKPAPAAEDQVTSTRASMRARVVCARHSLSVSVCALALLRSRRTSA